METNQYIVILILAVLLVASSFRLGFLLSKIKSSKISDILILMLMLWIGLITLFWVSLVVDANKILLLKAKNKCPEYVKIENAYILKK